MDTNIGIPFNSILDLLFLAIYRYSLDKESDFYVFITLFILWRIYSM
jgi:hypothetical protein